MFTLAYPMTLPEDRAYHVDARAVVPPIEGSLCLSCLPHDRKFPQIIIVEGFEDAATAVAFADRLANALRCASLTLAHGFKLPERAVEITEVRGYDGHTPTVFETMLGARPISTTAHITNINHLMVLAQQVDRELQSGTIERLQAWPELAVAVKLFSEAEFAGGETAKFIVLLSALEVLITKEGAGKRNLVLKLVGDTLRAAGRQDAKAVGRQLDKLYGARNALVHEAAPVTLSQVRELSTIVRDTLRILADKR